MSKADRLVENYIKETDYKLKIISDSSKNNDYEFIINNLKLLIKCTRMQSDIS